MQEIISPKGNGNIDKNATILNVKISIKILIFKFARQIVCQHSDIKKTNQVVLNKSLVEIKTPTSSPKLRNNNALKSIKNWQQLGTGK